MRLVAIDELDFSDFVRPGDTVVWGQACGEPQTLTERLMAQRHAIGPFRVFVGTSFSTTLQPEQADVIEFVGLGGTGSARRLTKARVLDVTPLHISTIDERIRNGALPVDVALVQLKRTNRHGEYSLGLASDYIRGAVDRARVVVAELNAQVPATVCVEPLHDADIDIAVETSRPPVEFAARAFGELEGRIAVHASKFIPDLATLEVGIGSIPDAILASLRDRRGLGVHSAIIGDRVADLMAQGVITNEHKEVDAGKTTTCLLVGTRRLYDFADRNDAILMSPVARTHGFATLTRLRRFVALNSALEVDLTGQVNAEAIAGDYIGLVGGQLDYSRAAAASDGGCPLVVLPSTAPGGKSRIVTRLGGPVTTPRSDAGVIVTEHGAADLRGASISERIRRMIAIAHPAYRDELEQEARTLDL